MAGELAQPCSAADPLEDGPLTVHEQVDRGGVIVREGPEEVRKSLTHGLPADGRLAGSDLEVDGVLMVQSSRGLRVPAVERLHPRQHDLSRWNHCHVSLCQRL